MDSILNTQNSSRFLLSYWTFSNLLVTNLIFNHLTSLGFNGPLWFG